MNILTETGNDSIETHCSAEGIVNVTETESVAWMWNNNEKILIKVVFPILATFGVVGNLTFILTIFRRKELHNGLSVFLVNLAICDIVFLVSFICWILYICLHSPIRYNQVSEFHCFTDPIFTYTWYFASVGFVTVISFERYLAICKPLKHRLLKGTRRNVKINICIWAVALTLSCTVVVFFYVKPVTYCLQIVAQFSKNQIIRILKCEPYNEIARINYIVFSFTLFFVPLCLNVIFYAQIIYTLSNRLPNEGLVVNNVRNQVARVLVANGVVFFICHLPYRVDATNNIIMGNHQSSLVDSLLYNYGLLILNSAINPYLYIIGCRHYRTAVYLTVTCKKN